MANGYIEFVLGTALLPVNFSGVTHLMTVRIFPGLNDSYVLGTDFVTQFGLVIDGKVLQHWLAYKLIVLLSILNARATSIPVGVSRCSLIPEENNLKFSSIELFRPNRISCRPLSW